MLTSRQIHAYSESYQRRRIKTCVKYALNFKEIIVNEYGHKILDLEDDPLSSIFEFRFDKALRKVTHEKRERAVGSTVLNRVKVHITNKYKNLKKIKATREISYKRIVAVIQNYLHFSEYVSSKSGTGKFSISNIKNIEDSIELAPKSWLFENIRYLFPKKYGFPIRDDL